MFLLDLKFKLEYLSSRGAGNTCRQNSERLYCIVESCKRKKKFHGVCSWQCLFCSVSFLLNVAREWNSIGVCDELCLLLKTKLQFTLGLAGSPPSLHSGTYILTFLMPLRLCHGTNFENTCIDCRSCLSSISIRCYDVPYSVPNTGLGVPQEKHKYVREGSPR